MRTRFVEVAPDVYAVLGSNGMPNAACVLSGGEVVIVDALFTPRYADEMVSALREVTDAPVKALVNTHFHCDHVFGNPSIPTDRIIAHERALAELQRRGEEEYVRELSARRPDLAPELVEIGVRVKLPTETFGDEGMTLTCGELTLEIRFHDVLAHTDHDITVFIPERGVLIAADLIVEGCALFMHDGDLFGLQDVLQRFPREGVEVIVPGHGEVRGTELIDANLAQIDEIVDVAQRAIDAGGDRAAAVAAGIDYFGDLFGTRQRVPDSVGQAYAKLTGAA
ncbi:MAG TPA: MBL fold metallo-hydrolase [Conexibacter sp.]